MLAALRTFTDRLLGRGSATITVPVMDGAIKPNRVLEDAQVVAELDGIDDLCATGESLFASTGNAIHRLEGDRLADWRTFDATVSAFAVADDGTLAVALDGSQVLLLSPDGTERARLARVGGAGLRGVDALAFEPDGALLMTEGSRQRGPDQWCHDLMEIGRSGRAMRWRGTGEPEVLADGLGYGFGVLPTPGGTLISESWRHRVLLAAEGGTRVLLAELPGYPSRMAPASNGGFWLSCFVCRTQLVEFVLREPAYRKRMIAEIDPRYWIAPALSSGRSFLEPLQGAGVKQMGVLKPWAPPRSYGLVLQVAANGHVLRSMHSQVDGLHHGITAIAELDGALYAASRGSGRLLKVHLDEGRS